MDTSFPGFGHAESISKILYYNPFFDYSSLFQPTVWHNALRWCHPPGTVVEAAGHYLTAVENIFCGDRVLTDYGKQGQVTNIITRDYTGQLTVIRPFGNRPVRLTPEHEIVVTDAPGEPPRTIPCSQAKVGQWVMGLRWQLGEDNRFASLLDLHKYDKAAPLGDIQSILHYVINNYATVGDNGYYIIRANNFQKTLHSLAIQLIYGITKALESLEVRCGWFDDYLVIYPDDLDKLFAIEDPSLIAKTAATDCIQFDERFVYRQIKNIGLEDYDGPVYSITVDPDHQYFADGILVKNCEYIVMTNGVLRSAVERVVSLFITDIEIEGTDDASRKNYKDFLYDVLGIEEKLRVLGLDYLTYGNFFVSLLTPFERLLVCPKCQYAEPAYKAASEYRARLVDYRFHNTCQSCGYSGEVIVHDHEVRDPQRYQMKRWRVYEMTLEWDPFTDRVGYIWQIPDYYKNALDRNEPLTLANVHKEVLEALRQGKQFKFSESAIYHGKEETLNGILLCGWGISRVFSCMRHAWYYQVLHRMNEAIGLDYVLPLRIITPMPRGGPVEAGDPLLIRNMGAFVENIKSVLDLRRRDPTIWHVSPFPLEYRTLGGDGRVLAPRELMEQSIDTLLNSMNIPMELYRGTMRLDAAPVALKLLQTSWSHLVRVYNRFLSWLMDRLATELEWDKVRVRLTPPVFAEDINNMLMRLRLMSEGRISQTTALQGLGLDAQEETRRMLEEQVLMARQTQTAQEQLSRLSAGQQLVEQAAMQQMAAQMGAQGGATAAPPGVAAGAPPPAGGGAAAPAAGVIGDPVTQILASLPVSKLQNVNPAELDQLATAVAQQLFAQPEVVRSSVLRQLKTRNELLWMSVKSKLDDMRDSARRQGILMAQQQMGQMAQGQINPPM